MDLIPIKNIKQMSRSLIYQRYVERIKRLRQTGQLTQAKVAKALSWTSASYSDIESYSKRISLDQLDELAILYNVKIGFLTDGHEEGVTEARMTEIKDSVEFM